MERQKYFQLKHLIMNYLDHYTVKLFVFLILINLYNTLFIMNAYHLVFLSDLFKASLKVLWSILLKAVMNESHLEYLGDLLKEWRNNLYLDLKTTSSKVMTWSSLRYPLRYHFLVCIKNYSFIVGIWPILNKELIFIFRSDHFDRTCIYR